MTDTTHEPGPESAPDFDGLDAGDEVGEPTLELADAHLIRVKPTPRQRLAGWTQGEVETPAWLTDPAVAKETAVRAVKGARAASLRAVIESPKVSAKGSWWATRGAAIAVVRVGRWLYDTDMHPSHGEIKAGDVAQQVAMAKLRAQRQKNRLSILGVGALVALIILWWLAVQQPMGLVLLTALAVLGFGWLGKPDDEHLLSPGVRERIQPRLTAQNIVRALAATNVSGLAKALEKGDTSRLWRSSIAVVKGGYKVWIQLPSGVVAAQLVEHEQRLAAALGRPEDCVIVVPKPQVTPGDLDLFVFDRPQLTADIGPGPLATAKRSSWWEPVHIGRTRMGDQHREPLHGGAWFVGGRPSSGKSSLCRVAAAHTALDPQALLIIVNLKGSPDYVGLRAVCHRYIAGSPETDPTVLDRTMDLLRWLLSECARRNDYLVSLVDRGLADSADVTPDLSAKHDELRPITVVLDEIHRLFDPSDNPEAEDAKVLVGKVIKAVRSVAVTLIGATQLAGVEAVPPVITRAARLRGCLVVSDQKSFGQIYGDAGPGVYGSTGVSRFRPGTVLLAAIDGSPLKVGCHNITPVVLAAIGKRALELRERAHTLTGEAAGEDVEVPEREDPELLLRDVLVAIEVAEPTGGAKDKTAAWLYSLEEHLDPDRAPGWLALELKQRGVRVKKIVRRKGNDQKGALGVEYADVHRALRTLVDASQDADEARSGTPDALESSG